MRVFVYGFFLYISADRHEESKDVKKKKTMALVYWICHVSQNQNRPRWSTVASSIINQLLLLRAEPSPLWSYRIRISANESQV